MTIYDVPADQSGTITAGTPLAADLRGRRAERHRDLLRHRRPEGQPEPDRRHHRLEPDQRHQGVDRDRQHHRGGRHRRRHQRQVHRAGDPSVHGDLHDQGRSAGREHRRHHAGASPTSEATRPAPSRPAASAWSSPAAAAGQNGTLTFTGSVNQRIALNISNDSIGTLVAGAKVSVKVGHDHSRRARRRRDERHVHRARHPDRRRHVHDQGRSRRRRTPARSP